MKNVRTGLPARGNRGFREADEVYHNIKTVPTPAVGGMTLEGPKNTPRRGSGAQTKARTAKGPMW